MLFACTLICMYPNLILLDPLSCLTERIDPKRIHAIDAAALICLPIRARQFAIRLSWIPFSDSRCGTEYGLVL